MNESTNHNSTRRSLVPIYILTILKNYTDRENHVTQEFIRNRISEVYGYQIDRKSLGKYVNLMLGEEIHVFGNRSEGYWYDKDCFLCIE